MEKVVFFAFILFFTANAEPPPISGTGLNQEQMAENVKKFSEVYKLATQLMNLGGNVLSNVQTGSGARSYDGGDNGVLGEVVRPQFRGVSNYNSEPSSYGPSSASAPSFFERLMGGSSIRSAPSRSSRDYSLSPSLSEYGGGPLGVGPEGATSQKTTALDRILNTFLGPSLGGGSSSSSSTDFFSSGYEDYGRKDSPYGNNAQGSNIQAIMDALTRSGAKPARPEPESGASTNFLSKLFGR